MELPLLLAGSSSCLDLPLSDECDFPGRVDGTKYKTAPAKQNCTTMCIDVVNRGNAKLSLSSSNIHLLYCRPLVTDGDEA